MKVEMQKELKRGSIIHHGGQKYYVKSYVRDGNIIYAECEEEYQNEYFKSVWLKLFCKQVSKKSSKICCENRSF